LYKTTIPLHHFRVTYVRKEGKKEGWDTISLQEEREKGCVRLPILKVHVAVVCTVRRAVWEKGSEKKRLSDLLDFLSAASPRVNHFFASYMASLLDM